MSDDSTPRIALVGCGRWGKNILRDLTDLRCEVHVVARSEASTRRATEGGAARIARAVENLDGMDGYVVAVPTTRHADVVRHILDHDSDASLFVEKPLCVSGIEAKALAGRAGDRIFTMLLWRYHPGVVELRRIARSGEVGKPLGLRSRRYGWANPHPDTDPVWTLLPHDLSIALEVFGKVPKPRWGQVERAAGMPAGVQAVFGENPWTHVEFTVRHSGKGREIQLFGTEGVAVLPDSYSGHVLVYRSDDMSRYRPEPERRAVETELPLKRELRAFRDHVLGGPAPKTSIEESRKVIESIEQFRDLVGL